MMKLSIIVPVYNAEKYLEDCIRSILTQKFSDFELILINDGSTDNSGDICDTYSEKHDNIKVIHQKNCGQSVARNIGLNVAKGDFIGFVDSDDWIHKEMYYVLINLAIIKNADIVACNFYVMNRNGTFSTFTSSVQNLEFNKDEAMREIYKNRILSFSPCNKIYRRNIFDNLRFIENIIFEDMDLSYKLIYNSEKIVYTNNPLYYYRYNNESTLRSSFSIKQLDEYKVTKMMYDFYLIYYPEEADLIYLNLFYLGIKLYSLMSIYDKERLKNYEYLIHFEKIILKNIICYRKLEMFKKIKIIIFLMVPKFFIRLLVLKFRIKGENV